MHVLSPLLLFSSVIIFLLIWNTCTQFSAQNHPSPRHLHIPLISPWQWRAWEKCCLVVQLSLRPTQSKQNLRAACQNCRLEFKFFLKPSRVSLVQYENFSHSPTLTVQIICIVRVWLVIPGAQCLNRPFFQYMIVYLLFVCVSQMMAGSPSQCHCYQHQWTRL